MTASPRILVVGSINVDLVVHAERLPAPGETVAGGRLERSGGGKGANQAVAAARAGAAVALAGAVGNDDLGAGALDELCAEGIDVTSVQRLEGVATGVALIVVDSDGNNQIAVASGANHAVTAAYVRSAIARAGGDPGGRVVPGGGEPSRQGASPTPGCMLTGFELLDGAVLGAAELARGVCPLVVNPAPARPLPAALCEARPLLTPNRSEAAQLTGQDDPEAAARALAARTGAPVVVTLGERGALLLDVEGCTHVPAPSVRAVDTTGAGDVFNGVLATELARSAELRGAVEAAVGAAAGSVTRAGARGWA